MSDQDEIVNSGVAIVGMVGRFPGARELDAYWRIIRDGSESITAFVEAELDPYGLTPETLGNPAFVKARGIIDGVDEFDPAFFGYGSRDALLMDPQQRLFLECCWEALETAGYDPRLFKGLIGVYGGATQSSYQPYLYSHMDLLPAPDGLSIAIGNDLPFLTTRVSYKLDLKGPSCPVTTACSTSLVAIHLACQGLLNAECDMALAGGVSLRTPQKSGYWYQEESILSPDGHCRSFDASAAGTVFSNGLGVVVLKRLEDALAAGDTVYAVIRGSAINNDGSRRASFTAPGVYGQSQVISDALAAAGVSADSISYLEAHGTATSLGDSIEIQALQKAFGRDTARRQYCALGTVKANIGHLDAAAGVAGLIKAVLMLQHRQLPPAAMFERPNPDLKLDSTAFFVNTKLTEWESVDDAPRRAGISSFGFGGTNAHVILEEAPSPEPTDPSRATQILTMSAESADGLERFSANLSAHFRRYPRTDLADAAYTMKAGRRAFRHRRAVVCGSTDEAAGLLENLDARSVFTGTSAGPDRPVVFMFPGQGSQHVGMAQALYDSEPRFKAIVDECATLLKPELGADIREVIFARDGVTAAASERLTRTSFAQPALFVIEYALARLYMSWGIQPDAMIGHSIGEWVAACIGGVVSLANALKLVAVRGRCMEAMPAGVMTAVPLAESAVRRMLDDDLWLAAVNAPSMCVVSGAAERMTQFEERLRQEGTEPQRLQTSHAFHSGLMDAALPEFVDAVRKIELKAPTIPFVSNVSGTLITAAQATDPAYWGRQVREAVRFSDGAAELLAGADRLILEVGPGQALTTLVRRQPGQSGQKIVASLRRPQEQSSDVATVATALARLWVLGARVDWTAYYGDERRQRIALPTYPFDRQRFWVSRPATGKGAAPVVTLPKGSGRLSDVSKWFYVSTWTRLPALRKFDADPLAAPATWLVFADRTETVSSGYVARLRSAGHDVIVVTEGEELQQVAPDAWAIRPFERPDYDALLASLSAEGRVPDHVLHLWGTGSDGDAHPHSIAMLREHYVLFWSVTLLTQALAEANVPRARITVVTTGVHDVTGDEVLMPGKATTLGLCRVIPQEYSNLSCASIDLASASAATRPRTVEAVLHDAVAGTPDPVVAYRGAHRWVETFRPVPLQRVEGAPARLRSRGVYLITGGLGDIALTFSEYLAQAVQARLVLVVRTGLPEEASWDEYLRSHDASDLTAQRIARVRRAQALGAEVLIVQGDASNAAQLRDAFERAEARFGHVDGVIHAAGLVTGDAFRPILETDEDIVRRQFQPKVDGTVALDAAIGDRTLDFCMLVSSLSAILGGLKYNAYASANAFLDAAAHCRNRTSAFPWLTVNWDGWLRSEDEAALLKAGKPVTGLVMTAAEGADAFGRILSYDGSAQIVVSVGDLHARIEQWVRLTAVAESEEPLEGAVSDAMRQPRPNLQTDYVAPRTELERTLATVWQEMLGLERVGVNDSFFELGGDSLLGIQVIARIKKQLAVKISAVTLYEGPTVAALAAVIEASKPETAPAPVVDVSRQRGERRREKKLRSVGATESLGA